MTDFLALEALGPRIVVAGPSNAGKSTLTHALAAKIGAEPVYLDALHHRPGTNWQPRPAEEFDALHEAAISGERWIMDGNYSRLMAPRLARTTGIIWLDLPPLGCLLRYIKRSYFQNKRHGRVDGNPETVNWEMINHILRVQPSQRGAMGERFTVSRLPLLHLRSMGEVQALYAAWGL